MTKISRVFATAVTFGVSALATHAFAQHAPQGGFAPMVGASDPCLLGTNVQPGACVGPVRVAPMILSQGPVQLQPASASQPTYAAQAAYGTQQTVYQQPVTMAPPQQQQPFQMAGCVPGYAAPSVPCNGHWVYAQPAVPQPVVQPAPQYVPAPQYFPAPVAYIPQPQVVEVIPTSFFTGGISYGAGFPVDTTYSYGGGGFGFSTGGGTRFSGVAQRAPLTPPPRRAPHAPPAKHHGCGC